MKNDLKQELKLLCVNFFQPKRKALSIRFPFLKPFVISYRRLTTKIKNKFSSDVYFRKNQEFFKFINARHQSVLMRRLGNTDIRLQKNKVQNLKIASGKLDKIVIPSGKIFSFWEIIGLPTKKKGYINGMLLSNGKVSEGTGGGLCQMTNLLFWLFLHTECEIIQRYHHSVDVFPDNIRILPFGSGATCLFNFVDLKIKNTSKNDIQLNIFLTEKYLKGRILSKRPRKYKFHITEKNHFFIKFRNKFFRYNEIWQEKYKEGKMVSEKLITKNFAPVVYEVTDKYLQENNHQLINFNQLD